MAQAVFSFLVFVVVLGTCLSAIVPGQLTVPPTDESRGCTLMTGLSLEYCGFGRNCTTLPNMREHTTLAEAEAEFSSFVPLLNCSDSMRIFLCFYYFPIPLPQRLLQGRTRQEINDIAHRFLPCRSVCDTARANCEMYIAQHSIQTRRQLASWQPHLNCSLFPDDNGNPTCIRRPSPSPTPPVQTDDQRPRTPAANASYTPTVLPPSDSPTATPSPTSSSQTSNSTTVTPTCATCALVRSGISTRALIKKAYSLMVQVNITNVTTSSNGTIVFVGKVSRGFTISCDVPKVEKDAEILLHTDMTPDCLCTTVQLNKNYLACGFYTSNRLWHLPTERSSGGCVLGEWDSKYDDIKNNGKQKIVNIIERSRGVLRC